MSNTEYNPFSITFGIEPQNYIERIKESQKIISEFSAEIPSNCVYIITGLRGSGKTVLLSTIANYFMEDNDWIVVDPDPKDNILENVASEIYETGKAKRLFTKTEFNFSFKGLTFSIEGSEPVSTVNTLLKKMLNLIKSRGKRVLITIDEADNSKEMKLFIQAYQSLIRLKYPVMLLMTGLYDNISKLQEDKSLTFLYRSPKIYLSPLNIASISSSYSFYLGVSNELAEKMARLTKGYAFAYQVLGYLFYENRKSKLDDDLLIKFDNYMAEYVYDKLYSELTVKEQEILKSFGSNEAVRIKELCDRSNYDIKYISVYRDRLIKKGIIYSPSYGTLEFTLPRFWNFLIYK
ncbi:MAG: ATP-binding protein [Erysipelotrichaceae bacterium]|nr:ATP-binding protein [Erysipelotrichaceae bacterium]